MKNATKKQTVELVKEDGVSRWKCSSCDEEHQLSAYVFAHWDEKLVHTCKCGEQHSILAGVIRPMTTRTEKRS